MEKSTSDLIQKQNEADILSSSISFDQSPKKCNLSFSINFDVNDINSDNSTDSENADLQIDISEVDNYEPSSKHKREAVEETSVLNVMEEEIERQLDAKAAKTNLTATNVKNILKHVITYEHLMAMVQKWFQDTENDVTFGSKLTRAKAKKLAAEKVDIPWPITTPTTKKASSEVQAFIQEELSEDSSDEEYNPEHDKQSDDDRETESIANNDVELQLSALVNTRNIPSLVQQTSSYLRYDPEGIFKIPIVPHASMKEESIGQRTRSKYSLSETPLEQIEQAFIPPDITADMDDWDCELDEDWDNFLKEFTQPLTQEPNTEDDPEADPEYNILEEEEIDILDKEELRADKAVEVPRKEVNDLIAELFELTDTFSMREQEISRKKKVSDNGAAPSESNTLNYSMVDLLPVLAEPELPKLVNPEQRFLLATQFRQHVQLMAQHFVMTYMHPVLHSLAKTCKQNLYSLRYLSNGTNSAFNAENLEEALKLVTSWENKFSDAKFYAEFKNSISDENITTRIRHKSKWRHNEQFFPGLKEMFIGSKALVYPQLLPQVPFKSEIKKYTKSAYLRSEEYLIALGVEQFLPFVISRPRKFKTKKMQLIDAAQLISHYLLPCREAQGILHRIERRRVSTDENPIKHYFEKGCAPRIIHYITLENACKAPIDQPIELLPLSWQIYINGQKNNDKDNLTQKKCIFDSYSNSDKQGIFMKRGKLYSGISNNHPLRNPIVNMLPKILPAISNSKSSTNKTDKYDNLGEKNVKSNDDSGNKKVLDNNMQTIVTQAGTNKGNRNFLNALKINVTDMKTIQTDTSHDKITNKLAKSSKVSKNATQVSSGLPQIRKTTPRLAKTKSAQNMKLMAQVLGSKSSSSCTSIKSKEKNNSDKAIDENCTASKVDNEEEIAELMLASTTIIKDPVSRKKAKQTRELEIIKRLLKAENPLTDEERDAKFAASYLQKLHLTLEINNPEIFKAVIKLFLDYSEKLDNINRTVIDETFSKELHSLQNKEILRNSVIKKDMLAVKLYQDICEKLENYPEMCTDFLMFLKPHQAAMIGKSVEYMMLQKMNDFIHVAQIYFAKQPSRIAKMMQAITQLSSDPHMTLDNIHTVMSPVFKGHPLVMDLFLQVLPNAKPPESLFASHMFENLTCPLGPCDKNTTDTENAPELYENIELPVIATYQEDPYGGENCKCDCHNIDDSNLKNNTEHCVSCGTRFLNGRIYLQTSEGLRPAKITFPGKDEEKLENIARVSLKVVDKVNPGSSSKKRRKSSKNDSSHEDIGRKSPATKYSLLKNNEYNDKTVAKSKKFTVKTEDQRKILKRTDSVEQAVPSKKMRMSHYKTKREKKAEDGDILLEYSEFDAVEQEKTNELSEIKDDISLKLTIDGNLSSTEVITQDVGTTNKKTYCKSIDKYLSEKTVVTIMNKENTLSKSDLIDNKAWTRQEDMILLQSIKKEYSENSFLSISEKLENRTVNQVKERCEILLSLMQKMM